MTTLREAVFQRLTTDATFMALLPGGLHQASAVGEIRKKTVPAAFDANGEFRATGLLRWDAASSMGGTGAGVAVRLFLTLLLYAPVASASDLDAARGRACTLLDGWWPTSVAGWEVEWAEDILDREDEALRATFHTSRFVAIARRGV